MVRCGMVWCCVVSVNGRSVMGERKIYGMIDWLNDIVVRAKLSFSLVALTPKWDLPELSTAHAFETCDLVES